MSWVEAVEDLNDPICVCNEEPLDDQQLLSGALSKYRRIRERKRRKLTPAELLPDRSDLWPTLASAIAECEGFTSALESSARGENALPSWAADFATTTKVELRELLGEGGNGVVYRAHYPAMNRDEAVKFVRRGNLETVARDRLKREAKHSGSLGHEGIVEVYDVRDWTEPDGIEQTYLRMEFVPGGTLADRLSRGKIEPREAARIALGLAEALERAHGERIHHRDLKPANVLLTRDACPKIADFGVAKQRGRIELSDGGTKDRSTHEGAAEAGMTSRDTFVGTYAYPHPNSG
jgi:serine/threonine protein kinase